MRRWHWSRGRAAALGSFCLTACGLIAAASLVSRGETGSKPYAPRPKGSVTFARDIAPILYQNCAACHRAGEVAPFTLTSYQDAKKRARQLALVAEKRIMPPWKPESHGEFQDERHLTEEQIGLLKQWADEGSVEGNAADMPPVPKFPTGWALGQPDLLLEPSESYQLEAEGRDVYRCFVVPTHFAEDRWVSALDVHPGNRAVVHHVIAYIDTSGQARRLDAKDPLPGYSTFGGLGFLPAGMLGGWASGAEAHRLPPETGILLPKGADVVLQVHYHKDGKPESDRTQVALYFNKGFVDKPLHIFPLQNFGLLIPPGDKNYAIRANLPVPADATLLTIAPHMHLLGRQMTVTATLPNGKEKRLIHISDWDFNWQGFYAYREPIKIPRGSRVNLTARYDNSAGNPRNPNSPPKWVSWGEQTTDEMCIAFLGYTVDAEHRRLSGRH